MVAPNTMDPPKTMLVNPAESPNCSWTIWGRKVDIAETAKFSVPCASMVKTLIGVRTSLHVETKVLASLAANFKALSALGENSSPREASRLKAVC